VASWLTSDMREGGGGSRLSSASERRQSAPLETRAEEFWDSSRERVDVADDVTVTQRAVHIGRVTVERGRF